ncbi:MAG: HD domain-containing protein [Solirubrobacteraceae bacterium]
MAPGKETHSDRASADQPSSVVLAALAFAARCHAGQRRESDGAPFMEHPSQVARLLRDAGCSRDLVVAGLLHDVVEHCEVSVAELRARFGSSVADLVQVLRGLARSTGGDAALLFAADTIAEVHELADQVRCERARFDPAPRESRARNRLERFQQMRLRALGEPRAHTIGADRVASAPPDGHRRA